MILEVKGVGTLVSEDMLIVPVPEGGSPTPQVTEPGMFTRSVPEMEDPKD